MGTWGPGNFDNDYAWDWLRMEVQSPLVKRIEEILANPTLCEWDEDGEAVLMPAVHVLILLHEKLGGTPVEETDVIRWKKTYLEVFDKTFHTAGGSSDFMAERRAVISSTFDKLQIILRT
jgi:hypothetical protein